MAKLWAIAIGINQYQYFQPLGYAQADAEGIRDFLIQQAGWTEEQCLLMTDSSVPMKDKPTLPTKHNILQLLEDLAANSWQPQDQLWFFFSGYGINYEGQDYLIPIDGDSQRISETAIEIRQLMQTLQIAGLSVLLILDFNRAFGTQANSCIGEETIELAQELQISTILSCQPDQFSHESSELGHSFFTAALLEALRYGNVNNLAGLESYLSVRTPELCQHHWRPIQNPVTFTTSPKQSLFLPEQLKSDTEEPPNILDLNETFTARSAPKLEEKPVEHNTSSQVPQLSTESSTVPTDSPIPAKKEKTTSNSLFAKSLLLWGTSTLVVSGLLLLVFLRNQSGQIFPASKNNGHVTVVKPLPSNFASLKGLQEINQAMLELQKMSLNPNQASDLSKAIAIAQNIKINEAGYKQAQKNIRIWNNMILDIAQNRAANMEYSSAIAAAELVKEQDPNYREAQAAIKQWQLLRKQYLSNKTLLEAAQALIRPEQASTYNRAIEVAKRIPQSQPGFPMAQESINQWSREIIRLAKNRAENQQFSSAIATATLAPEDTAAYAEAQELIQQWQEKVQSN
ncbi:caspase family protein [Plectonema cf. radiosum LEGE 06105]|uniref:Caspase family protein n=1 Tax=Plectonema cf. radiosum LEGE 06105 TaxID=945769 RepID=A0A8J7K2I2_9CYAN|nr:caspase family protein [Plectonema radiosum]MBE9214222.1 caspase family protein [Plectonema cf. radiosum LEGE 06105]